MTDSKVVNIDGTPYNEEQVQSSEPKLRTDRVYVFKSPDALSQYTFTPINLLYYLMIFDECGEDNPRLIFDEVDEEGSGYMKGHCVISVEELHLIMEEPVVGEALEQLEVGKSYVLKDRESTQKYFENHSANVDYTDAYYDDETGFTIEEVDTVGRGYIDAVSVINDEEIKFFKEVPEL